MRECRNCHKKKELKEFYENKGVYSRSCAECIPMVIKSRQQRIEAARAASRGPKPGLIARILNKIKRLL